MAENDNPKSLMTMMTMTMMTTLCAKTLKKLNDFCFNCIFCKNDEKTWQKFGHIK